MFCIIFYNKFTISLEKYKKEYVHVSIRLVLIAKFTHFAQRTLKTKTENDVLLASMPIGYFLAYFGTPFSDLDRHSVESNMLSSVSFESFTVQLQTTSQSGR